MVWSDQKDEVLCRKISLIEPYKFKARAREKSNSWKAIADNLNSLDGFKVDARAVRNHYGVIEARSFRGKRRIRKKTSEINPEVTPGS